MSGLKFTRIDLRILGLGKTVAVGTVEINECLVVQYKLINGPNGYFVSLGTSNKGKDGKWYNDAYLKDTEVSKELTTAVISRYNETLRASQISNADEVDANRSLANA